MTKAVVALTGIGKANVSAGVNDINFSQEGNKNAPTIINGGLSYFAPGDYALVVHVEGDMTDPPTSMGDPYTDVGTAGFLGTINVGPDGTAPGFKLNVPHAPLSSIIGRGLIVHAGPGSNPGPAVAWGVIGLAD